MPSPRRRREKKAARLAKKNAGSAPVVIEEKVEIQLEESAPEVIEAVETEEIAEEVEVKEKPAPKRSNSKNKSKRAVKSQDSEE